jgi:hypothetical protein
MFGYSNTAGVLEIDEDDDIMDLKLDFEEEP